MKCVGNGAREFRLLKAKLADAPSLVCKCSGEPFISQLTIYVLIDE